MDIRIYPAPLSGAIHAIPSKAVTQRALICAALAREQTTLELASVSEDIEVVCAGLAALGCRVRRQGSRLTLSRSSDPNPGFAAGLRRLDCGDSGAALRFLLPVAAALGGETRFDGSAALSRRPLRPLLAALRQAGAVIEGQGLPLVVTGPPASGSFHLSGGESSQYLSGLLLAAPLLAGETLIRLTAPLVSAPYVELTVSVMARFGVRVEQGPDWFRVAAGQHYQGQGRLEIEGCWSDAALLLVAGAVGGGLSVSGLAADSRQGDRRIVELLRQMGAAPQVASGRVSLAPAGLQAIEVGLEDTPDLAPPLVAAAALAAGVSRFRQVQRLRLKESDRLDGLISLVNDLGGRAWAEGDALLVAGREQLAGGTADGRQDHRLVMAAAIMASRCAQPVLIRQAQAVNKSHPGFWQDYRRLGGRFDVV